jgi:hypothetical protein
MGYQDDLKKHLADYKRMCLGIDEPGVFQYRGRDVPQDHILPLSEASRNLLEEAQPILKKYGSKLALHKYFHHLNSSQAFAFNLFFPYFDGTTESASALLRALGCPGTLAIWEVEQVPDRLEESNIDVVWRTTDGAQTFCEVKLSEAEFGKAADDLRHRTKFSNIYHQKLAPHLQANRLEMRAFLDAYQFNRNVWHMVHDDRSRLIFLLPRANAGLWASLKELLSGVVAGTRERISAVATEDVIASLSADERCPDTLRAYARKLKQKYLIQRPS